MHIPLNNEYSLLVSQFKMQARKHKLIVESAKMTDKEYVVSVVRKAEKLSDIELMATCQRIKELTKSDSGE